MRPRRESWWPCVQAPIAASAGNSGSTQARTAASSSASPPLGVASSLRCTTLLPRTSPAAILLPPISMPTVFSLSIAADRTASAGGDDQRHTQGGMVDDQHVVPERFGDRFAAAHLN